MTAIKLELLLHLNAIAVLEKVKQLNIFFFDAVIIQLPGK